MSKEGDDINSKIAVLLIGVGSAALVITLYHCVAIRRFRAPTTQQRPRQYGIETMATQSSIENSTAQLIPAYKFQKGMGLVGDDGTCAICLSEFEEGEELRTLPECLHSYHVECIDMWLHSHTNCPMCRTDTTPSPGVYLSARDLDSERPSVPNALAYRATPAVGASYSSKYTDNTGLVSKSEDVACAVCLNEFKDGEEVKVLPECACISCFLYRYVAILSLESGPQHQPTISQNPTPFGCRILVNHSEQLDLIKLVYLLKHLLKRSSEFDVLLALACVQCRLGLLIVSLVGLGLSIVFGCLLLALVAELYYLLWWKRRFANKEIGDDYSSPARELFFMFCLRKPSSLRNNQELCSSVRITDTLVHHDQESQLNINTSKDLLLRPFSDDNMDTELMRLHSLSGPPRFLFTIVEETKEDLESEDGRSRADNKSAKGSRSRSLSDLLLTVETPYLTPLASPPFFTPPLTPSYNQIGFNHLFESSKDAEFNKIRSSPPPKFKFLQDAEEKLYARRLMQEAEEMVPRKDCFARDYTKRPTSSNFLKDEDDGPFITIIVDRNKEREFNEQNHQLAHHPSSSSQVLPLVASPSTSKPAAKKSSFFH
ncbi:hypothetical protein POTOM_036739 [Populus tomentosa]|uniref:RING-type domain-containing protein n=1 Tax=Populus tomentosa TaxID=118781 RepID=A0A8X7Z4W5_POPTO|nr:hypothetical protein POTOM_036739 [Populus tomentosa]